MLYDSLLNKEKRLDCSRPLMSSFSFLMSSFLALVDDMSLSKSLKPRENKQESGSKQDY